MPNHCSCDLFISGTDGVLTCLDAIKGEREIIACNRIIPYPECFASLDREALEKAQRGEDRWTLRDGFNSGGYEWCCERWGTKWGCYDSSFITPPTETRAEITFDSAWSPPVPAIEALSKQFPELTFRLEYYESGMGFCGVMQIKNGMKSVDNYREDYVGDRGG